MMFRGIPNKREFLARAFGRLGVLGLLEQTIARRRPGLVVLTYHRIAEPGDGPFYDPVISATPESFRAQVEWLHNRVRLLTLDELIDQVESGSPWREPVMLLTFDDGYRDNFDLAVPILRERNVPATFFIPTAFLESPRLPWWDHVAYVIKQTHVQRFIVERQSRRRSTTAGDRSANHVANRRDHDDYPRISRRNHYRRALVSGSARRTCARSRLTPRAWAASSS